MASCSSCDGLIVWALSPRETWMPFDAAPVTVPKLGRRLYKLFTFAGKPVAEEARPHSFFGSRWTTHFDTCPNRKDAVR